MPTVCRYYRFLHQAPEQFNDEVRDRPGVRFVQAHDKQFAVNLIGTEGRIDCVRIDIPVDIEQLSDDDVDVIHRCLQHMLSVLRITYDHEASYWGPAVWMFDDLNQETLGFRVTISDLVNDDFRVDYDNIGNVFIGGWTEQTGLKHLADSVNSGVPARYRLLSACQVLEAEFSAGGKLDTGKLRSFLSANSRLTIARYLSLRAKCAHIDPRGEARGFIELSNRDAATLDAELPEVQRLAGLLLNARMGGRLRIVQGSWPQEAASSE